MDACFNFLIQKTRSIATLAASTCSIQALASPVFSKVALVVVSEARSYDSITCKRKSTCDQTAPVKSLFFDLSPATVAGTNFVSRDHISVRRQFRDKFTEVALFLGSISLFWRLSSEPPNIRTLL